MASSSSWGGSLRSYEWKAHYRPADNILDAFYIPALSRGLRYDRQAGFFTSHALAVAAEGVAHLVAREGRMRLLVGAQLTEDDVHAILAGVRIEDQLEGRFLEVLRDPATFADLLTKHRLEVLAWLVSRGQLEVRVVVEADPASGRPIPSGGYFHAKGGVIWDEHGEGIAFSGSINETKTAIINNYESFHVFCSWRAPEHFQEEVNSFERLWSNTERGWRSVTLPEAVRQELIRYTPDEPPTTEPAQRLEVLANERGRWLSSFVADSPFLVHKGWHVGVETAPLRPFPHQRSVAYQIIDHFPGNWLLCDEVGLGKTIEAGLVLRSLLLSGWVKRVLVLVPRSLAKQWQEALRDQFLIDAPFYDGSGFVRFHDGLDERWNVPPDTTPWEAYPIVIASAQLVKRAGRAEDLLAAPEWDVVLVDEAHHARRRDFQDLVRVPRRNNLLQLLERLKDRTKSLLLLTATPMQVHPVEVWDLLRLLGLPKRWQDDQDGFLAYYTAVRAPFSEVSWPLVLPLLRESIETWGWDARWESDAQSRLGPVSLSRVRGVIEGRGVRGAGGLDEPERADLRAALTRHGPVERLMFRHTRELLREYSRRGVLAVQLPTRRPEPRWLEMSPDEEALYRDVDAFLSTYYKQYEEKRQGLGFVMTIYRRRLTSSLRALTRSLERHRDALLGRVPLTFMDDEDEPDELSDKDIEVDTAAPLGDASELREIEGLLRRLHRAGREAKYEGFRNELSAGLLRWDQVLVFTQYTDTLDFLREELQPVHGATLGCYSGRGGEVWSKKQNAWIRRTKEDIQTDFTAGRIKILLCTEAAGEGLNLQSCGVLINYDMPWNPMKVEQRIGRVDRIGQRRPVVEIYHYFYEKTVEAEIYKALGDRIDWFKTVVGELQPILQLAEAAIRRVAMAPPEQRQQLLEREVEQLRSREGEPDPSTGWAPSLPGVPVPDSPVTLEDVESVPTAHKRGTYPVVLLGATRQDDTGGAVASSEPASRMNVARMEALAPVHAIGYYVWGETRWGPVETLDGLRGALDRGAMNVAPSENPGPVFERDRAAVPAVRSQRIEL